MTLIGTITPGQSGPGSNGNEGVDSTVSTTGALPLDAVQCHIQYTPPFGIDGSYPLFTVYALHLLDIFKNIFLVLCFFFLVLFFNSVSYRKPW